MLHHSHPTSGIRLVRRASLAALLVLALSGCVYSFTGGGLPGHIRTVAIVPFENATAQPLLSSDLQLAFQEELPRKLGVRLVDERVADALVRGRITGYEESSPNVRPGDTGTGANIVQQQVRLTFEAEIYDRREDRPLWQASSLSGVGTYRPDRDQASVGRVLAIQDLVRKVIDGAQSQW
jgi:hypothetical protein